MGLICSSNPSQDEEIAQLREEMNNLRSNYQQFRDKYNKFLVIYGDTLKYNTNELNAKRIFILDVIDKYVDCTHECSDGIKVSDLTQLVEQESNGKYSGSEVERIIETLTSYNEGIVNFKQVNMFDGSPHYQGFKFKSSVNHDFLESDCIV